MMADLVDMSKRKEQKSGAKYILICMDVFNRQMFTRPLKAKEAKPTLAAYRQIIAENDGNHPTELSTDMGREFTAEFAQYW